VFEDSLFASNQHRSGQRGLAAVMSFGIQAVFLGLLVLIPLLYTDALPLTSLKSFVTEIQAPPGPPQPPAPPDHQARRPPQPRPSNFDEGGLVTPREVPTQLNRVVDPPAPPPEPYGNYIDGATPGNGRGTQMFNDLVASNMRRVAPPPANIQTKPMPVSKGVIEGLLIHKITPIYPKLAIVTRQQGTVTLHAIIGRDGTIQNLQAISGPPLLIPAALDAVQRWRYRPYLLNNEPVEVETQITVNFTLGG
jgi:protein TonB